MKKIINYANKYHKILTNNNESELSITIKKFLISKGILSYKNLKN